MTSVLDSVVFDLGGVLVDWNPRYLYRKLISEESAIEDFLENVCSGTWNEQHDAGHPIALGTAELIAKFPGKKDLIQAYFARWPEMMAGEIPGTSQILNEIYHGKRHKIYALSNWSAETFPYARQKFEFFSKFNEVLVSGAERMIKPDPRFFNLLTSRHGVDPRRAVFIDDVEKNIKAAEQLGFHAIHFKNANALRQSLVDLGVLPIK